MKVSKDKFIKDKYWNISDYLNHKIDDNFEQAFQKTQELLDKAMIHRNVADVPISIALSGGLDSSLNLLHEEKSIR